MNRGQVMSELENENIDDDWKIALRSEIIKSLTGAADGKDESYAKVGEYYYCSAPASLYKYYNDNPRNLENIKNNKMWFSAPCNFNDVFDCDIPIDSKKIFDSALKMAPFNVKPGSNMWRDLKAEVNKGIKTLSKVLVNLKKTTGVSCFSESYDSLLMWAHYANNHRGLCVEYDLMDINKEIGFSAIPVVYSKDRTYLNSLENLENEGYILEIFINSLISKSPEWKYEKEWRIVRDDASCGNRWDCENNGALLDMITPSSIILGCEVQCDFQHQVEDYCKSNKINLYKMEKDEELYKLNKKCLLEFNDDSN